MPTRALKPVAATDWHVSFRDDGKIKGDVRKACRASNGRVTLSSSKRRYHHKYPNSLKLRWRRAVKYDMAMTFVKNCLTGAPDFKVKMRARDASAGEGCKVGGPNSH